VDVRGRLENLNESSCFDMIWVDDWFAAKNWREEIKALPKPAPVEPKLKQQERLLAENFFRSYPKRRKKMQKILKANS
jgi:hypothetical protein